MKYIALSQGKQAVVDDEDYGLLSCSNWYFDKGYASGYFVTQEGKRLKLSMHRFLNDTAGGRETDHINHNRLDNRRANLRTVTHTQNQLNRQRLRGVRKTGERWRAQIMLAGRSIHLGTYDTFIEARSARIKAEQRALESI